MRVLILGGEGMLGHKVFQVLSSRFDTYVTFRQRESSAMEYPVYQGVEGERLLGGVDAANFDTVVRAFARVSPDVVINCIGIVKQLAEAKDALISIHLNALFPHRLYELCRVTGTRILHMSTDCVFSGRRGSYTEDDLPDPLDLYGRSKLLGEVSGPGALTLRTSIFGRDFAKQTALLEWFLSNRGGEVRGYTRAIYTGFPTQILADIMGDLIADYPDLSGLYHVASEPISKYDLLTRIRDAMGLEIEIEPYGDFYCDRSLDTSRFLEETGYSLPSWEEMIATLAADETPYDQWRENHVAA
jgi:dTDP-4-dehydrorhamnose reductase